jgi:hypothetical protein
MPIKVIGVSMGTGGPQSAQAKGTSEKLANAAINNFIPS